mmetsp:Transcript_19922/g.32794  ORF Transcript_19922/g.32794 Transcript_19922/m.32794 type:complete len:112 (+) Transcript_19922:135-470(+)
MDPLNSLSIVAIWATVELKLPTETICVLCRFVSCLVSFLEVAFWEWTTALNMTFLLRIFENELSNLKQTVPEIGTVQDPLTTPSFEVTFIGIMAQCSWSGGRRGVLLDPFR